jgi:alpha-tubulin suppressor-like RCC1 family protein
MRLVTTCCLLPLTVAVAWPSGDSSARLGRAPVWLNTVAKISAHGGQGDESHTCALTSAGVAYCWGANTYGELGNASLRISKVPVAVSGGLTFATIGTGGDFNCGQTSGGAIYCWGYDAYGQLGDGAQATQSAPVPFKFASLALTSVSLGGQTACGLTADATAYCWGWGYGGETAIMPAQVLGGFLFSTIEVGGYHTCGLLSNGAGYCWGLNQFGELGNGVFTPSSTPVAVTGRHQFTAIAPGGLSDAEHTCALTKTGDAYCWGTDSYGQLGDSGAANQADPVEVKGGIAFSAITAGGYHTCALATGGSAYCWGRNDSGQLGDGSRTNAHVPVAVAGGLTFAGISAGASHTCGVTTNGAAYCWGDNAYGQLGDGTTSRRTVPTAVVDQ